MFDNIKGNTGIFRAAWPMGDHNCTRIQICKIINGNLIVPENIDLHSCIKDIVNQVECE